MFSVAMTVTLLDAQVDHTRLRDGRGLITGGDPSHDGVVVILQELGAHYHRKGAFYFPCDPCDVNIH